MTFRGSPGPIIYSIQDRLSVLAAELAQRNVNVIVAFGGVAAQAARDATKAIPIVTFIAGSDPVELGLAPTLAKARRQSHWCRARGRSWRVSGWNC